MAVKDNYKKAIAEYLGIQSGEAFLFWKGRVALYAILKAMGVKKGDEVIVPAFTCVVVPNAIIYLGAKPVYVDINPETYNLDVAKLPGKITPRTKVILAQNTFGLAPDLSVILEIAGRNGIKVVEDCTHGFGGLYKGQKNGTVADASFFSSQWNKPFSTGIGGIAVVRDKSLALEVGKIEASAIQPGMKDDLVLKSLFFVRNFLMPPFIFWPALKFYRYLSSKNLIIGSSSGNELAKPEMEEDFIKGACAFQADAGIKGISSIESANLKRVEIARKYSAALEKLSKKTAFAPDYGYHTFLKYPLLVKDRALFLQRAEKNRIELGEWFISPIHPIEKDFHLWHYQYGEAPVAEVIAAKMVNLPTNPNMSDKQVAKVLEFITENQDLIE
jgi:perosamine synthetase